MDGGGGAEESAGVQTPALADEVENARIPAVRVWGPVPAAQAHGVGVVRIIGVAEDRVEVGALRRQAVRERVDLIQIPDPPRHARTKHKRNL